VKSISLGTGSVYMKFVAYKLKVLAHCCACNCWLPNNIYNTELVAVGALLVMVCQTTTNNAPTATLQR